MADLMLEFGSEEDLKVLEEMGIGLSPMPDPDDAIVDIDESEYTSITVSCWRETSRLPRMLSVFQIAMSLAYKDGDSREISGQLLELHDHKGCLTATWRSEPSEKQKGYVESAWDEHNECQIEHTVWED